MSLFGYVVPILVFVLLLTDSWDWFWTGPTWKSRPTIRGMIMLFCGMSALGLGWWQYRDDFETNRGVLNSIKREGTRLLPNDFQVMLEAWAHVTALIPTPNYEPPRYLPLVMSIDSKIFIRGDFSPRQDKVQGFTAIHAPAKWWYYNSKDMFVTGLGELSYLDQLENKSINILIPRRELGDPFQLKSTGIRLHIYIKGREIVFDADPNSYVIEKLITRDMLKLPDDYNNAKKNK